MASNANYGMYRNQLQEYAQKSGLPLPVYTTVNEGFDHKPRFRATVLVNGTEYTSRQSFSRIKSAENDVAKLAFECIEKNMKIAGPPNFHLQEPKMSKSILYEFATKKDIKMPTYETFCAEGFEPLFMSTLTFNGKTYTSEVAGSKKMAEQFAASNAIQSLLGTDAVEVLSHIIKSKSRHGQTESIKIPVLKSEKSLEHPSTTQYGRMTGESSARKRKLEASNNGAKRVRFG